MGLFHHTFLSNGVQLSGLRSCLMWKTGFHLGLLGFDNKFKPASAGVLSDFLLLQVKHAVTQFSQEVGPFLDFGITWSIDRSSLLNFLRQYWQVNLSLR